MRVDNFSQLVPWLWTFARRYRAGLIISISLCLLSIGLYFPLYLMPHAHPFLRFLADIELRTLDMRFRIRGPKTPSQSIAIVAIDQKAQDVLGRWPFPRKYFAEAVNFLREAHARVIAFDANFPQPDQNSALTTMQEVRERYRKLGAAGANPRFDDWLKALEEEADNDRRFADALAGYDNAILGYFFLFSKEETLTQNQALVQEFINYLSFQAYPQVAHPEYGKMFEGLEAVGISPNLPKFAVNAKNFGFYNVVPDSDGTVRREPVIIRLQGNYYPSLDVATALAFSNRPLDQVRVFFNPNGLERIDFGSMTIPTDPEGFVQIDFHGPAGTFPTYSLADVVNRKLSPDLFRDRVVLIGPTATGIADMAVTPFQRMAFPGVEVHANFIDNLIEGHFIRRGPREELIDLAFLVLFSLGAGIVLSVVPPTRATALLLVALGLHFWLCQDLFATQRVWIAVFLPTATLSLNYAGIVSYRFFFEEREKRKVDRTFRQYVAPGVITQLLQSPGLLRLGGEEKELTAMFADIRGFTTLSEGLSPAALVELLNEYLSEMTDVIFRQWGTLDKYIGDAIMAFWGAPYPQPDHAERACRAALLMVEALKALHTRWDASGRPRIDFRIGINTGPMLVGNMGSTRRFNFTIMGDNVNLASRLEGLNKTFGTRILLSENTYQLVREKFVVRELDFIRVKGKTVPVKIYELLGPVERLEQFRDLILRFHQGLNAYRAGLWENALAAFDDIIAAYPDDVPSHVFIKRCHDLRIEPPEGVWDGVYVMKTK